MYYIIIIIIINWHYSLYGDDDNDDDYDDDYDDDMYVYIYTHIYVPKAHHEQSRNTKSESIVQYSDDETCIYTHTHICSESAP